MSSLKKVILCVSGFLSSRSMCCQFDLKDNKLGWEGGSGGRGYVYI